MKFTSLIASALLMANTSALKQAITTMNTSTFDESRLGTETERFTLTV